VIRKILENIAELELKPSKGFKPKSKNQMFGEVHEALLNMTFESAQNGWISGADAGEWLLKYASPDVAKLSVAVVLKGDEPYNPGYKGGSSFGRRVDHVRMLSHENNTTEVTTLEGPNFTNDMMQDVHAAVYGPGGKPSDQAGGSQTFADALEYMNAVGYEGDSAGWFVAYVEPHEAVKGIGFDMAAGQGEGWQQPPPHVAWYVTLEGLSGLTGSAGLMGAPLVAAMVVASGNTETQFFKDGDVLAQVKAELKKQGGGEQVGGKKPGMAGQGPPYQLWTRAGKDVSSKSDYAEYASFDDAFATGDSWLSTAVNDPKQAGTDLKDIHFWVVDHVGNTVHIKYGNGDETT